MFEEKVTLDNVGSQNAVAPRSQEISPFGRNDSWKVDVISTARDEFEKQLNKIEKRVCGDYKADGCSEVEISACEEPPSLTCAKGICTVETPELCELPFDPGPCEESETVYTFDPKLRICVSDLYSGCEGNENRFDTFQGCESTCNPTNFLPDCPEDRVPIRDCVSPGLTGIGINQN